MKVIDLIKSAFDAAMIRKGQTSQRHEFTYWWNENIANDRKEYLKARRKHQRTRGMESFFVMQEMFASKRRILIKCIRVTKNAFRNFATLNIFKQAMPESNSLVRKIVTTLFHRSLL